MERKIIFRGDRAADDEAVYKAVAEALIAYMERKEKEESE